MNIAVLSQGFLSTIVVTVDKINVSLKYRVSFRAKT